MGVHYNVYRDWERDTRHGHGSLSFDCEATKKTLRLYNGEWKYDQMSGSGMKSFSDGGLYKGDFKNGMRHGQGTQLIATKTRDLHLGKKSNFLNRNLDCLQESCTIRMAAFI